MNFRCPTVCKKYHLDLHPWKFLLRTINNSRSKVYCLGLLLLCAWVKQYSLIFYYILTIELPQWLTLVNSMLIYLGRKQILIHAKEYFSVK